MNVPLCMSVHTLANSSHMYVSARVSKSSNVGFRSRPHLHLLHATHDIFMNSKKCIMGSRLYTREGQEYRLLIRVNVDWGLEEEGVGQGRAGAE